MALLQTPTRATESIYYGILIVCEDSKSGYDYLCHKVEACKPKSGSTKVIEFELQNSTEAQGTQADKLVEHGIAEIKRLNEIFYNNGEEAEEHFYKQMFCVADVDDNEQNGGKITIAFQELETAQNEIPETHFQLLLSNECLEIWYILHYQDIVMPLFRGTKPQVEAGLINSDESNRIKNVLKNCTGVPFGQQKSCPNFFEILQEGGSETEAIRRAKELDRKEEGELFASNPSSALYILIEILNNL